MGVLQKLVGFATRPFQKNGHAPAPPPDKAKDAKRILEDELASSYRPHLPGLGFWSSSNDTPDMTRMLADVEAMRAHPKVFQPLSYYKSGISNVPLEVEDASSPEVAKWSLQETKRFWSRHRERAQECYDYGRGAAELVYTDDDGSFRLDHVNGFAALDCRVLLRGSDYAGVRVQGVKGSSMDLWGPSWLPAKAWWMAHRPRYSRWYGWPQTYAAWRPWRRLAGRDGAEDIMDLGAYRYALMPVIGRYPERDNVPNPRTWGEVDRFLTNRDKMREFVESFKSGAAVAMSSTKDDKGAYVWDLQLLQSVFDIQALLLYTQDLEKSISFGVGVPPELLEASETGSGYSGRAIPLEAFIAVCQGNAEALLEAIMWQVIDPLVRWNFGPDAFVKLKVADMLKARMQPQGQQPPGEARPPQAAGAGPARFATKAGPDEGDDDEDEEDRERERVRKLREEGWEPHWDEDEGGWCWGDQPDEDEGPNDKARFASPPRTEDPAELFAPPAPQSRAERARQYREKKKAEESQALEERLRQPPRTVGAPPTGSLEHLFPSDEQPHDELHKLTGAQPGSHVSAYRSGMGNNDLYLTVDHPHVQNQSRAVTVTPDGELVVKNNMFFLKKPHRGGGMGGKVFADQVQHLLDIGADKVKTVAGRSKTMNGYITWPLLGYDTTIDPNFRGHHLSYASKAIADADEKAGRPRPSQREAEHRAHVALGGLPIPRSTARVSDLLKTPDGRAIWARHGYMTPMEFDLKPGSRSLQVLNAYRQKKGLPPVEPKDPAKAEQLRQARRDYHSPAKKGEKLFAAYLAAVVPPALHQAARRHYARLVGEGREADFSGTFHDAVQAALQEGRAARFATAQTDDDPHPFKDEEYHAAAYEPFAKEQGGQHASAGNTGRLTVAGRPYFWKGLPRKGAQAEEDASRLAEAMGAAAPKVRLSRASRAAATDPRRRPEGAVGGWLEGRTLAHHLEEARAGGPETPALPSVSPGDIDRLALFTYLGQVGDRHPGNLLVGPGGRVHSIDHEYSFGRTYEGEEDAPDYDAVSEAVHAISPLKRVEARLKGEPARDDLAESHRFGADTLADLSRRMPALERFAARLEGKAAAGYLKRLGVLKKLIAEGGDVAALRKLHREAR